MGTGQESKWGNQKQMGKSKWGQANTPMLSKWDSPKANGKSKWGQANTPMLSKWDSPHRVQILATLEAKR